MTAEEELIAHINEFLIRYNERVTEAKTFREKARNYSELRKEVETAIGREWVTVIETLHSLNMYASPTTIHNTFMGDGIMGDKHENNIDIGGNVIGSSVGSGTSYANNIAAINEAIGSSRIPPELSPLLESILQELERIELSDDDREDATTQVRRIATELKKSDSADGERISKAFKNLSEICKGITPIVALGGALAKAFGWND